MNPRSGLLQCAIIAVYTTYLVTSSVSEDPYDCRSASSGLPKGIVVAIQVLGIILTVITLLYATLDAGSSTRIVSSGNEFGYSYSWFHFVFTMSAFYMASVINSWRSLKEVDGTSGSIITLDRGVGAFWVKAATSWIVSIFYIWTLIGKSF